ncbi:hypothetical protein AS159_00330 [Thermotoga sp. Ku-13t]|uniref:hypothetical protein n=1 Tax=Thermotoga sp. Ku-13t TaxID=1755813 RepID=UPI0013EAA189|nr:hypothetical protein [Thermotoga sp. Ku-13t]KAF2958205.1 hypothetical protein AS159_00330 [Thermotoga sp. Ku-13t]
MRARRRQKNYFRYVVLASLFVVAFLWLGAYLHFVVESKRNVELRAREMLLSSQVEGLLKEVETLRREKR